MIDAAPPPHTVFRTLFEEFPEAMYVSTTTGRFTFANRAMERLLGYTRSEFTRIPVTETYAVPSERRRFRHEIESNGKVKNFRLTLRHRDRTEIGCVVDAVVWRRDDGAPGGYIGTIRTAGRVIHEHSQEEEFALAMRGSNDGLWSLDLRESRMRFSARWKALLGYAELDFKDSFAAWTSQIHPDDIDGFREAMKGYLNRKRSVFSCYFRMKHRDGSYRWMMARGIAENDAQGKPVQIAGSMSDVGAHMKVIERLKKKEDELSRENSRLSAERDMLSRYFPDSMLREIGEREGDLFDGYSGPASALHITIVDTDRLVEQLSPQRFQEFIDEILTDLTDLVMGKGGSVNRIAGDGLLATFGTPVASTDDTMRAADCAAAVEKYTRTYNDVRPDYLADDLVLACGLATGTVFAGSVGSNRRLDYVVHGQPIRRAASLARSAAREGVPALIDAASTREVTTRYALTKWGSTGGYLLRL